ncbi:UNVERIFIED_CONTAM: Organelle RRM domain-containing protein 1, chloroplastic [Sesamum latifolium]|uniref:Organelle RRM domain-containing protein 1, chloroplastic n=1 Tax=Sesamum latifolium TaxID=2727402 RepID=A0AAW2T9R5_9LAMI
MEARLSSSSAAATAAVTATPFTIISAFSAKLLTNPHTKFPQLTVSFRSKKVVRNFLCPISCFSSSVSRTVGAETSPTSTSSTTHFGTTYDNRNWMVLVEAPQQELTTKSQIIDYYVSKLESVLGSEKDAQMCIYDASWETRFGFCCDIDGETAHELANVAGVLSVKPDPDVDSIQKDYSFSKFELDTEPTRFNGSTLLFPAGNTKHWLVRMDRPAVGAIRKAQVVDYYVQVLTRVLRNEKDAQMCMYHISWQSNYGFCCELDDECAQELAAVPGVLSVQADENFGSDNKDYGGIQNGNNAFASRSSVLNKRSKKSSLKSLKFELADWTSSFDYSKRFTHYDRDSCSGKGLSFYTSEKTLRAAFEGFGELVEVKIIMDKISKRSKGYAFVEYTTEEAASTALREMNGKVASLVEFFTQFFRPSNGLMSSKRLSFCFQIINGWMITVDVAKKNPPKYSRGQPRPTS